MKRHVLLLALTSLFLMPVLGPTQLYSQQKNEVPTVHNKKLDEKLLKFFDNDQEKKETSDFINNVYKQYGTYLGSAIIQFNIDHHIFQSFLFGDIEILKKFDENAYNKIDRAAMQKVVEKGEPIKQWLNENYFKVYNQPFGQFDHMPDYEELNGALDNYIEKDPYKLFKDGLGTYRYNAYNYVEFFKKKILMRCRKKLM